MARLDSFDLGRMPRMSGWSPAGSGKSKLQLTESSLAFCMKGSSDQVKFLMVDPRWDLSSLFVIPHLPYPCSETNPRKAIKALQKVVDEWKTVTNLFK